MANPQNHEADRILVIRLSSLGDILLTAPALRALRSRFPLARIDLLTFDSYAELAGGLPGVDRILEFNKPSGIKEFLRWQLRLLRARYSLIIDLQNSFRSAVWRTFAFPAMWVKARRHRIRRFLLIHLRKNLYRKILPVPLRYIAALESLGCQDDGGGLELQIPVAACHRMQERMGARGFSKEQTVILCPGARHATKRWSHEKWTDLARAFLSKNHRVLILGDENDRSLIETIMNQLADDRVTSFVALPLLEAAVLLEHGACVISNDSGLMHLATAVGTPVIALFGPTVEEFGFFPFRAEAEVVQKQLPCRPCSAVGTEQCPKDHFKCMEDISVPEVLEAAFRLTKHPEPVPATRNP